MYIAHTYMKYGNGGGYVEVYCLQGRKL